MYRDHRKGPGGSSGGATYPGGPHGLKWERGTSHWWAGAPPGPPLRLGLETLGVGGRPTWLGGQATPLAAAPLDIQSPGGRHPPGPYIKRGREGSRTQVSGASLSLCNTSPSRRAWRSPAEIAAASTTTPSCCWISINLSLPLLDQEGGDVFPNRTCVERGGAVRSALGPR